MLINPSKNFYFFLFILFFQLFIAPQTGYTRENEASSSAYLLSLNIHSAPTQSRLVFFLDRKTYGKVRYVPDKNRLIIEFANTRKRFSLDTVNLKNANISSIKCTESKSGSLHFVLTLNSEIRWKIHFQSGKAVKGARLQLDVISVAASKKTNSTTILTKPLRAVFADSALKTFAVLNKEIANKRLAQPLDPTIKKSRTVTIFIDAGHGGNDAGACGVMGTKEKNVVLAIAKRVANEINKQPNLCAVLTRKGDYFVPLRKRLQLARKNNADLFVAIHADAYFDKHASGVSVYALSKRGATTEAARWLAQRENYAELDDIELNTLQDRSTVLRSVLIDLAQTATIRDSLRLGNKILDALDDVSLLHYKRIQQAPFVVLKSPDIPSVLVETGFISNPYEEKRLSDAKYQEKMAQALAQGIICYVKNYGL